ncbi:MAG: 5-keto-L-gluconate epimerase [Bacillota bacterium]
MEQKKRKISLAVSTPEAKFSAVVYREPFASSFAKVAALGCGGIEVHLRDPGLVRAEELTRLAREHGLTICALGTGQAYGADGLSFTDPDPSVRRAAVERIKSHIMLGAELGCCVILGLIRGRLRSEDPARARRWMMDGFRACLEEAEKRGVDLAIEPLNRYETELINTVEEALSILDELGSPRAGLLLDTFHMNIEEPSLATAIRRAGKRIKHVHVADSNRWAPGFGHIDFGEVYRELAAVGYEGFLSAEILPYPDPEAAGRMTARTLLAVIAQEKGT